VWNQDDRNRAVCYQYLDSRVRGNDKTPAAKGINCRSWQRAGVEPVLVQGVEVVQVDHVVVVEIDGDIDLDDA